jgi:hypothetical protein
MKKSLIALALLTAIATPVFAQSRVQQDDGIFAGAPAGTDAYQYHQMLEQNQGS